MNRNNHEIYTIDDLKRMPNRKKRRLTFKKKIASYRMYSPYDIKELVNLKNNLFNLRM